MKHKFTETQVELAAAYWTVLLEHAKNSSNPVPIRYGKVVELAQQRFPDNELVKNGVPLAMGKKLELIGAFCRGKDYPDITSLCVNSTGTWGVGIPPEYAAAELKKVVNFSWATVQVEFDLFIAVERKAAKPMKRRRTDKARQLMSDYFYDNRAQFPVPIGEVQRDAILALLIEGYDPADAFQEVLAESGYFN